MRTTLAVLLLLLSLAAVAGAAPSIGVGAFGGTTIPVIQDDTKSGSLFGGRADIGLTGFLTVEPFYAKGGGGKATKTFDDGTSATRSGFDQTVYGANLVLGHINGASFSFYPYGGINQSKLTRPGSEDLSETGYDFGLGIAISPASSFTVLVRGEVNMIKTGDTSRKFANATAGINFNLPVGGGSHVAGPTLEK